MSLNVSLNNLLTTNIFEDFELNLVTHTLYTNEEKSVTSRMAKPLDSNSIFLFSHSDNTNDNYLSGKIIVNKIENGSADLTIKFNGYFSKPIDKIDLQISGPIPI